jgi:hypothetical protein
MSVESGESTEKDRAHDIARLDALLDMNRQERRKAGIRYTRLQLEALRLEREYVA